MGSFEVKTTSLIVGSLYLLTLTCCRIAVCAAFHGITSGKNSHVLLNSYTHIFINELGLVQAKIAILLF